MTKVLLSHIPEDQSLREEKLPLDPEVLGLGAPFSGQLLLSYELQKVYGKVIGRFQIEAPMQLQCSLCLRDFDLRLQSSFVLQFEKSPEDPNPRNLDPGDPELNVVFFDGDEIEFGEEIRQEFELLVPFAPHCQEDCKGLCPQCGTNWNLAACHCAERRNGGAFDALRNLFPKEKEQ